MGRKIFFIHPPESLKNEFFEYVFKKEFELYLLEDERHIEALLTMFHDAIVFINIDYGMSQLDWVSYVGKLQDKYKKVTIAIFSKTDRIQLKKSFLMDIQIKGGFIHIENDNWKTIEIINKVLEVNEARGRRKSVRLDFNSNESRGELLVKIFTQKGYLVHGTILSVSSAGLLVTIKSGRISEDDNVEKVIFSLANNDLHIIGYLLKRFENGDYFISFEDISDDDKGFVQTFIFENLQKSFKRLLQGL